MCDRGDKLHHRRDGGYGGDNVLDHKRALLCRPESWSSAAKHVALSATSRALIVDSSRRVAFAVADMLVGYVIRKLNSLSGIGIKFWACSMTTLRCLSSVTFGKLASLITRPWLQSERIICGRKT